MCGLLLNGIFFFLGGGGGGGGGEVMFGPVWAKAKAGNSFWGGVYSNLNVFGACLIHIS